MADNVTDIAIPDNEEVWIEIEIVRLKNNKAAGITGLLSELFKNGHDELVRYMQQLLCKIMPKEQLDLSAV